MAIVDDAEADMGQLAKVVEEDPSLTMQALNLCNSAYYSLPVQVNSVAHAVRYLGIETVGGLAMAAYFRGMMRVGGAKTTPWLEGAGHHLLMTAQIAEKLTRSAGGLASPSVVFTAGLLHDVGKLVFSKLDHGFALEIKDLVQGGAMPAVDAEKEILGMNHAEAGALLAERWKVPDAIIEAIHHHHTPLSEESLITRYVFLADGLYYLIKQGIALDGYLAVSGNFQAMESTGVSKEQIEEAVEAFLSYTASEKEGSKATATVHVRHENKK
jgi:putative nucleotidyltransferase with HDIG domain